MAHPCCGFSLRRATKMVAIFEFLICSAVLIFLMGNFWGFYAEGSHPEPGEYAALLMWLSLAFLCVTMPIVLFTGADTVSMCRCIIWLIFTGAVIFHNVISFMQDAFCVTHIRGAYVGIILSTLYRLYTMWIVYAFVQEIVEKPDNEPEIRKV